MGATAAKYILTYSIKFLLIERIYKLGSASRREGRPPKSHYAHTYGPGLINTFILCFSASWRKRVRFLLPVSKSNYPFEI